MVAVTTKRVNFILARNVILEHVAKTARYVIGLSVPFSNQYVSLLDKTPWVRVCHLNSRKVLMHLVSLVRDI